jgi:uncharacterized protein YbcV (DUF1398 family)
MGKKRRMLAHLQKFGRKFASHPRIKYNELESVSENSEAEAPVLVEEPKKVKPVESVKKKKIVKKTTKKKD